MPDAPTSPTSPEEPDVRTPRAVEMMRRAREPLGAVMVMVTIVVVGFPLALGFPSLALTGLGILALLAFSFHAAAHRPEAFGVATHAVYASTFGSIAYAVWGMGVPPVITVYFPAIVLLAAAYILGARAALFWSVPSLVIVAAGVAWPPEILAPPSPGFAFATRAATLATILAFAVSFRRAHDRQAEALLRSATTDSLTGLANRRELERALEEALRRSNRYERSGAVLFVDLDGVKDVNDSLGHAAGDELIQTAARRIASHTRTVDTAARLGGDEFVILLSELEEPKSGVVVARKMLELIAQPCIVGDERISPSASIGIALFPEASMSTTELLRLADDAMYEAKRAGGDCIRLVDATGFHDVR